MNIVIDTTSIDNFFNLPPDKIFWVFLGNWGWIILAILFLWGTLQVYLVYIHQKWSKNHKSILLAIDIPRGNEQSPKAVENIFSYLAGAHSSIDFFEKWFKGEYQKCFSFEIISLEGYTQFLIYSPLEYRNLVESAVYSQYPDAEISEVDDYINQIPKNIPNDEYDLWGTEFIQSANKVYPIKCYQEFEHQIGPSETQFKDPMAALMDLFGSLGHDEYLWFQMILIPTGFDWGSEFSKEIDKIFGRKAPVKKGLGSKLVELLGEFSEFIYSIWKDIDADSGSSNKGKTMMDLTPDEERKVLGIQSKSSKLSFQAKFRVVYIAKPEVLNKPKVVNGIIGYIKQFAALDLNSLKPDLKMTMTRAKYFFVKSKILAKKRKIFNAYINRSAWKGRLPGLYNIEELATVWHFPIEANVKAALIQKAPGRKADAPASLPVVDKRNSSLADIFQENFSNSDNDYKAKQEDENNANLSNKKFSDNFQNIQAPELTDNFETEENLERVRDLSIKKSSPPSNLPVV